ncbi:MAG: hypothetical protein KC561_14525 [Myxococcales bacterium]|nr:hypothetical protein [Myxococcales bacterium]
MRGSRKAVGVLCALFATLSLARTGNATSLEAMSLEQVTASAEIAFSGTVESSTAAWNGTIIVTESVVRVDECLVGVCSEVETVRQIGGQVGDIVQQVAGAEQLEPGDHVLLFLHPNDTLGGPSPVGLCQGVFYVDEGVVWRELSQIELVPTTAPLAVIYDTFPTTYDVFAERVRELAAELPSP